MPRLTPNQSFYPSPTMAMAAATEKLAYVAMLNPDAQKSAAFAVVDLDPTSSAYGQLVGRWTCLKRTMSCTTSAGTPAARASVLHRRTPTWSGATSWRRAWPMVWATMIHSAGYLSVSAVIASVVFEKLGVGLLRRAWVNLDLVWATTLVVTSVATLVMAS